MKFVNAECGFLAVRRSTTREFAEAEDLFRKSAEIPSHGNAPIAEKNPTSGMPRLWQQHLERHNQPSRRH